MGKATETRNGRCGPDDIGVAVEVRASRRREAGCDPALTVRRPYQRRTGVQPGVVPAVVGSLQPEVVSRPVLGLCSRKCM